MLRRCSSCDCATSGPHCQRIRREGNPSRSGGSGNLLPFSTREQATASESGDYGMRTHRRRTVCSPLQSICEASGCATPAQNDRMELENWRRRPDLNRGWRFCRFNGVVNRVVSCWSLVGPAPRSYLVFGRNGRHLDYNSTWRRAAADWVRSAIGTPCLLLRGQLARAPTEAPIRARTCRRTLTRARLPTSAAAVTRLTFDRARPRVAIDTLATRISARGSSSGWASR